LSLLTKIPPGEIPTFLWKSKDPGWIVSRKSKKMFDRKVLGPTEGLSLNLLPHLWGL
jgi:hypothetical protein